MFWSRSLKNHFQNPHRPTALQPKRTAPERPVPEQNASPAGGACQDFHYNGLCTLGCSTTIYTTHRPSPNSLSTAHGLGELSPGLSTCTPRLFVSGSSRSMISTGFSPGACAIAHVIQLYIDHFIQANQPLDMRSSTKTSYQTSHERPGRRLQRDDTGVRKFSSHPAGMDRRRQSRRPDGNL